MSTILLRRKMNFTKPSEGSDHRARIAALEKAFAVLEMFGPETPELRIADVARRGGMNRSSAQRLVHTLVKSHWLERDALSGVLSLGHRACYPAHVYLYSNELIDLVMPLVVELNARTGLSADLWLLDGKTAVTLARVPSPAASLALAPVGSRAALAETAPGRALLSLMDATTLDTFLATWTGNEGLLRERIASERSVGFSFDGTGDGGSRQVIATAFRDAAGQPLAAISLSGPVDTEAAGTVTGQLCETVSRMGELMVSRAVRPANLEPNPRTLWPLVDDENDPLAVTAVSKSLHLFQFFHPQTPLLTLTQLSQQTGFPVPTVQRITDTLAGLGYLKKDQPKRAFHVSERALDLLYRFQMGNALLRSVWPRLIRLREECGLRCSFCILDGTEIIHLLHVQSRPQPAFRTAYPGRRLPAVSSSGGRAILSWLPPGEIDRILSESPVQPGTPFTVTNKDEIRTEILEASVRGVAFTDRQSIRDEVNVAAAVPGPEGRPAGAIVVSAPVHSWSVERLEREVVPLLVSHARGG
ncbi:UNVERIFIED_ORG: DNA-binding IclR family transcriptional regulator [Rhizobium sp. SORGH_AS260]|nr:DNA-binding IclR family transcriptional regulator [Rhizobium sp. SORGH_AS_0285]MDP9753167.1 DNA-binding IclR family transcriptional regulator [Rhizobium sp. SORGH_AS_0260]MDR6080138.1 DNA-binding IclR family transcriptional regulator [Agrobacterium sp. SORGH_AS_0440]